VTTPKTGTIPVTIDTLKAPWLDVSRLQCNTRRASRYKQH